MGGGGSFLVLPIERPGRVDYNICKVHGRDYPKFPNSAATCSGVEFPNSAASCHVLYSRLYKLCSKLSRRYHTVDTSFAASCHVPTYLQ